jgi:hypothetical protein
MNGVKGSTCDIKTNRAGHPIHFINPDKNHGPSDMQGFLELTFLPFPNYEVSGKMHPFPRWRWYFPSSRLWIVGWDTQFLDKSRSEFN